MSLFQPTIVNLLEVKIDEVPLIPDLAALLTTCWVESSVNLSSVFHLSFRGSSHLLMRDFPEYFRLGAKVKVEAVTSSERHLIFTGVSTGVETEWDNQGTVVLRGFDHSFLMQRQRRVKGYKYETAAEIVGRLAVEDGVVPGIIDPTTVVYDFITQPNISDWDFVKQLASRNNRIAYFDTEGLLQFRAPGTSLGIPVPLEFEEDVLYCRAGITASDQVRSVTSRGWKDTEKLPLIGKSTALTSEQYKIPGAAPEMAFEVVGGMPPTLTETGTPYSSEQEVSESAQSLAEDITSAFAELEIEVVPGNGKLVPAAKVVLSGAGPTFDGEYTIDAARHEMDAENNYSTRVWMTGRQARTVYALAAGGGNREPRVPGVVNAIVTDVMDPMDLGRVRLQFPWFDDDYQSDWARVVQFGGRRGGGVINPEVRDEVLVAFDRGSFDHPYVLGGLYSEPDRPSWHSVPLYSAGIANRKSIVTPEGGRIELLDIPEESGVRLQTADKALTVFLDQTNTTISITGAGMIDVTGGGDVNITAPKVNITGDVTISGATQMDGDVTIGGATQMGGDVAIGGATQMGGMVDTAGLLTALGGIAIIGAGTIDGAPLA